MGSGQLTEALQNLVRGPGGKEGSGGPQEPLPDGGPSLPRLALCHLWCRSFRRWGPPVPHLEPRTVACPQTACHPGRAWPSAFGGVPVAVNLAADSVGEGGRSGHHHQGRRKARVWARPLARGCQCARGTCAPLCGTGVWVLETYPAERTRRALGNKGFKQGPKPTLVGHLAEWTPSGQKERTT